MKNIFLLITLIASSAFAGRLQNGDFATLAELTTRGASASALLNDTKVYVTANGINKQLSQSIIDGDIGAGGGVSGENMITNSDFERNLLGWTSASGTAVRTPFIAPTEFNKFYSLYTTTATNGFYETEQLYTPESLANGDLQYQALVMPVSGTWSMQAISGTTIIASQTLTVSSDFKKSPIIFTPSGAVSNPVKLRFQAIASGSVIGIDNAYVGETVNLKNGAVVEPFRPYTVTTIPGLGTLVNPRFEFRRVGDSIEIQARFQVGTVDAALIQIPLPPGFVASSTYAPGVNNLVGYSTRGQVAAATFTILAVANQATLQYGTQSGGTAGINAQAGNIAFSSGDQVSFFATVKVNGLTGSSTTFDSVCPNDISCQNVLSVKVATTCTVSPCTITSQAPSGWVNSITRNSTGNYTVNFANGVFTQAPTCHIQAYLAANAIGSSNNTNMNITSGTLTFSTGNTSSGAQLDTQFDVTCRRQGADSKDKVTVEGYMSKNVSHGSSSLIRIESATINTGCTTIADQNNSVWINTVNSIATGVCNLNFVASTWSVAPKCFVMANGAVTGSEIATSYSIQSTSQFQFYMSQPGVGAQNRAVNVLCIGIR